jgi:hypothetical protein
MDIKKFKGSVSKEKFLEELLPAAKIETLGELWEDHVNCNNCNFRDQCRALSSELEAKLGSTLYCNQVIDILLGTLDPEDIEEEA